MKAEAEAKEVLRRKGRKAEKTKGAQEAFSKEQGARGRVKSKLRLCASARLLYFVDSATDDRLRPLRPLSPFQPL